MARRFFSIGLVVLTIFLMVGCVSWWKSWHEPHTMLQERKLLESSLVLLKNENSHIPLKNLSKPRKIIVSVGSARFSIFEDYLNLYAEFGNYQLNPTTDSLQLIAQFQQLRDADELIFVVGTDSISTFLASQINDIASDKNSSLVVLANPDFLTKNAFLSVKAILYAPIAHSITQELTAQILGGGIAATGTLEKTLSPFFKEGIGFFTTKTRLSYTIPEEIGVNRNDLRLIDTLILEAMHAKAMPSCQILVAAKGKVFYHKAFGFHTYDSLQKATTHDIYDLASVTKILAGTAALMKLYDQNLLPLDSTLSYFLPYFDDTDKDTLILRNILTHQAGFVPFIDFGHKETKAHKVYPKEVFRFQKEAGFDTQLAEKLFIKTNFYQENILPTIAKSKLSGIKEYKYSDLGFILVPELVERTTNTKFEELLYENFYEPLSAPTLVFNPTKKYARSRIVPTERDSLFRKTLVWGSVHDEAAAMRGGISGHAGLFGNANDVAKLLQLYLNGGTYGDMELLKPTTLAEFTRCQFCEQGNRRGLGFDKPLLEYSPNGNTARSASPLSFGHFGFTGTMIWADPKHELIYIFLSNRVYPTRKSTKLMELNTRTRIQQVIYDALEK